MSESFVELDVVEREQRNFMVNVYWWMSIGLLLTSFVSYTIATSQSLMQLIVGNKYVFMGLLIAEIVAVGCFYSFVKKLSVMQATLLFLGYAAMNGLTLSVIFLLYTTASIVSTFIITAGTFGTMSFYGMVTKRDLTSVGNICFMGLIGIILASIVNYFMHSCLMDWVITYVGILVFIGLIAYDTQKIKQLNVIGNEDTDEDEKEAITGALILYLDFINLFLKLLRVFGRRR